MSDREIKAKKGRFIMSKIFDIIDNIFNQHLYQIQATNFTFIKILSNLHKLYVGNLFFFFLMQREQKENMNLQL